MIIGPDGRIWEADTPGGSVPVEIVPADDEYVRVGIGDPAEGA